MAYNGPTVAEVLTPEVLSSMTVAFMQDESDFVADRAFPRVTVPKLIGTYRKFNTASVNRNEMKPRQPSTESSGGSLKYDSEKYEIETYALHNDVAWITDATSDAVIDQASDSVRYLAMQSMIQREVTFASTFFTQATPGDVWTFSVDGAASATAPGSFDPTDGANNNIEYWSTDSSTPINDIQKGHITFKKQTGVSANVLILGAEVANRLYQHPDIIGRIDAGQTSGAAMANNEVLAKLFSVDEVLVTKAIENVAKEGQPAQNEFIGGKNALLIHRPRNPGLMTPSSGYTFEFEGMGSSVMTDTFELREIKSTRYEVEQHYTHQVVNPDAGYFFNGVVQ